MKVVMTAPAIQITVNGVAQTASVDMSIADLLAQLQKNPKYLAVERNKTLVPRSQHASCFLCEGDQLEIVTLVGGG